MASIYSNGRGDAAGRGGAEYFGLNDQSQLTSGLHQEYISDLHAASSSSTSAEVIPAIINKIETWAEQLFSNLTNGNQPHNAALYETILENVAEHAYRKDVALQAQSLEHKYDSRIHSDEDAVAYAAQALKFLGDPFTAVTLDSNKLPQANGTTGIEIQLPTDGDIAHGANNKPVGAHDYQSVKSVVAGSPAARAGIQPGDKIIAIDGIDVHGKTPLEISDLVRGVAGTITDVTFSHAGVTHKVELTRIPDKSAGMTGDKTSGGLGVELAALTADGKPLPFVDATTTLNPNSTALQPQSRDLVVECVQIGSAADKSGIRRGDIIRKIDGEPVGGKPMEQEIDRLRGNIGSPVDVTVLRQGKLIDLHVIRGKLGGATVSDKDLGNGITYLRLANFEDPHGADELKSALQKHSDSKAFVLDLRDNPGGLVEQSWEDIQLFLKRGKIASLSERVASSPTAPEYAQDDVLLSDNYVVVTPQSGSGSGRTNSERRAEPYMLNGRPLVIITNGGTASAAEMLTGALHDDGVAITLGERTFGKGIGQSLLKVADAELRVTSLQSTTPSGKWAGDGFRNRRGLDPDVKVPDRITDGDPQLNAAVQLLKKRLNKSA